MQITINNHINPDYEVLFGNLIKEVFGFSFAPWFERKLWDERYESYSVIENGRMLTNLCIYKTDMLVCGKPFHALQFGGVATRKSERGKGLSRLLMEHVLAKYPEAPAFLGANPSVLNFYPLFGFRRVQTYRPEVAVEINNPSAKAIRLNPDDALVRKALHERGEYSKSLDSVNTQPIQMFHLLLDYPDVIYHLPNCGAVVVAKQDGESLFIADVIMQKPIPLEEIIPWFPFTGIKRVEFGFCPDYLCVAPEWKPMDMEKEPYFIRGDWKLPEKYRFPIMSET